MAENVTRYLTTGWKVRIQRAHAAQWEETRRYQRARRWKGTNRLEDPHNPMRHIPNILTLSRIGGALLLLWLTAFSPQFWALYIWCGITDVADGFLARRWGIASPLGAALDTLGDVTFMSVLAVVLAPKIFEYGWLTAAVVTVVILRFLGIAQVLSRGGSAEGLHANSSRLLGLMVYLFPLGWIAWGFAETGAFLMAAAATVTVLEIVQCAVNHQLHATFSASTAFSQGLTLSSTRADQGRDHADTMSQ